MLNLLVSGATGQLGAGMFEADDTAGPWQASLLLRPRGAKSANERAQQLALSRPGSVTAVLAGDITKRAWGLDDDQLDALADSVDAVVNLGGDTRWVAPERDLQAGNVVGALQGYALAERLQQIARRPIPYVQVSSVFVAPAEEARIPEAPSPRHGGRTPYEHSKWMAEQSLLARAGRRGSAPLVIARVAALVGNSTTGATVRRNSLYLLADTWSKSPRGVVPLARGARVDALPREVAADWLLRAARAAVAEPSSDPVVVHVACGDAAPATAALFEVARALGSRVGQSVPRAVTMPVRAIVWGCENVQHLGLLSTANRSALIGLRYVALQRVFENGRLASLIGERPGPPSVETLARLVFGLDMEQPRPATGGHGALARFVA